MHSWWGGSLKCSRILATTNYAVDLHSHCSAAQVLCPGLRIQGSSLYIVVEESSWHRTGQHAHLGCEPCNGPAFTLLCGLQSPLPWPVLLEDRPVSLYAVPKETTWHKRGQHAYLGCPPDNLVSWAASSARSTLVRLAQNGVQLAARLGQQGLALLAAAGGGHAAAHGACSTMSGSSAAALRGAEVKQDAPA